MVGICIGWVQGNTLPIPYSGLQFNGIGADHADHPPYRHLEIVIYRIVLWTALADIKMKLYNYKIKNSFVSPKMMKARVNKTGFNIMIVDFLFIES